MTIDDMKTRLKKTLNENRYLHSIGVMEEAVKLALHYNADVKKAEIAGLLHDCAKYVRGDEAAAMIKSSGIIPDNIQKRSPSLLHSMLGPYVAKKYYEVTDQDILEAIYWHTTGRAGMTPLEKIIFIADFTESSRTFEGADEARKAAYLSLDRCVLICADLTIKHVLSGNQLLHPFTVEARNDALLLIGTEKDCDSVDSGDEGQPASKPCCIPDN